MLLDDMKCGCGKEGRYVCLKQDGTEVYSCNKHSRCPEYHELAEINKSLVHDLFELLSYAKDLQVFRECTHQYKDAEKGISEIYLKYRG